MLKQINSNFIILGCGYVGTYFLQKNPQVFYTNRTALNTKKQPQIYFDLKNKDTWQNIPVVKNILWTFPAANDSHEIENTLLFFDNYLQDKNVIILSSTSAYCIAYENEIITEASKLYLNTPRFYVEEKIRNKGANIVHLSGIIGPNRNPLDWYKKNLIKHEDNILNYIHVYDIVYFLEKLFQKFIPAQRFNLSSQDYQTHKEISDKLIQIGALEKKFSFANQIPLKNSKKISCAKILAYLEEDNYNFIKYPVYSLSSVSH